jgi:hypothetical protein
MMISGSSGSSSSESLSLNTSIVLALRRYGTIPLDFLARVLGRRKSEILSDVEDLQRKGIVAVTDEKISLSDSAS